MRAAACVVQLAEMAESVAAPSVLSSAPHFWLSFEQFASALYSLTHLAVSAVAALHAATPADVDVATGSAEHLLVADQGSLEPQAQAMAETMRRLGIRSFFTWGSLSCLERRREADGCEDQRRYAESGLLSTRACGFGG